MVDSPPPFHFSGRSAPGCFLANRRGAAITAETRRTINHQLSTINSPTPTSFYKRATFVTHLPTDCLYSPSHFWLHEVEPGRWRVGFTKFATRMLGEIVEVQWEKAAGAPVSSGEIIGSIEGFKAISDIYCVADGTFVGGNSTLRQDIELVSREPYAAGWLYEIQGKPDAKCIDLTAYRALLDATIDRMLQKDEG